MGGMTDEERLLVERIRQRLAPWLADASAGGWRAPERGAFPGFPALFEHTLLAPEATAADVDRLCDEAIAHGFHGVCVAGRHVRRVARRLEGTGCLPVAVVGFPLGSSETRVKAFEAAEAVRDGAAEVDMVIPIGAVKSAAWEEVREDVAAVVRACGGRPVKAIVETGLLDRDEVVAAALLAQAAGAAFVKTSTGFGPRGATVEDVRLLRAAVGDALGVKASGAIRTAEQALAMWEAGADRIGASASVRIAEEAA